MTDPEKPNIDTSDTDALQEIAARVMIHLEEAHEAARRVQEPGLGQREIEEGFDEIRSRLGEVEKLLSESGQRLAGASLCSGEQRK